jgi:hypothetical protein
LNYRITTIGMNPEAQHPVKVAACCFEKWDGQAAAAALINSRTCSVASA